jgi:hypothetical protein
MSFTESEKKALGNYYRSFEAGDTFLIFLPAYKTKPIRWANGFLIFIFYMLTLMSCPDKS